ncbi:phage tail length tape measure family protein [Parasedimentitalea huanghaiensis]|uniref:Bacteriophage tail tape measure N-terminal domain-containing protein n=1 Tax=Parasedimentitalea huanghaiensis TaxID=2682100 RepID=A0A6L6WGE9_9RHOB|nr:phage tail length tape measure family protein [Zongyanglinia huanghaiensis]MVO16856.1 hypothetical protein [Zongyanglinia huanghaiensis]
MSFVVSGKVLLDGAQAVSELKEVKAAKDGVKTATAAVNAAEAKATATTRKLGAASSSAAAKAKALSVAEQSVAREAMTMGNSHRAAAGQVGNLTAQFNDIGVMMAAGQNPLQLAIQQGTQISQVIGPMGAAGAVQSLKAGFLGMISPISIITIGSIAAAAAMSNWLTGADEDAETLEEAIQSVADAIDVFAEKSRSARQSSADMLAEFGTASPALRLVLADMAALAKYDASQQLDATAASVRNLVLELAWWDERGNSAAAQDFLGLNSIRRSARETGAEFARNLEILQSSEEPATKLQAALDVRDMLLDASGGLENLNVQQREFYDGLAGLIRNLEIFAGRLQEPWQELKKTGTDLWSSMTASAKGYLSERVKIETNARNMLAQMQREADVRQAELQFGRESTQATLVRQQAERAAYEETLATLKVSEGLKDELRAAFEEGQRLADLDMTPGVNGAAEAAARLVDRLGVSVELAGKLAGLGMGQPGHNEDTTQGYEAGDPRAPQNNQPGVWTGGYSTSRSTPRKPRKGGGGASQINAEREAIERLIARERERLEILRETDPVMQEMARVRDILKNATDAEREAVEALIRERLNEQQAVELTNQAAEFLGSNIQTLAEGMAAGGDQAAEAWKQVEAAILAAALQAALLGDGPWADMFGLGGDTGGLIGIALGGIGLADGGTVYGAGGNKDDKVPAWLSPGETVVTAKATRQFRPLLQAMNDGVDIPGLADGGTIATPLGSRSGLGGSAPGQPTVLLRIQPSPLFKVAVEEQTHGVVVEAIEDYDQNVAPETVKRTLDDPRRIG